MTLAGLPWPVLCIAGASPLSTCRARTVHRRRSAAHRSAYPAAGLLSAPSAAGVLEIVTAEQAGIDIRLNSTESFGDQGQVAPPL